MNSLNSFLQEAGYRSLDLLWFPLLIWSICALTVYLLLRIFKESDVLYQYHTRVALVAGIPLGMAFSLIAPSISGLFSNPASPEQFSFIVLQNPIAVTPQVDTMYTANWGDPNVWVGFATLLLALTGLVQACRLAWNYYSISRLTDGLPLYKLEDLDVYDSKKDHLQISVAFSDKTGFPFTFGWRKPVIVIPSFLMDDREKTALVVRHEMKHIEHADYLINAFVLFVKSIIWFHPLLHLFDREIREYREIYCDTEVLADRNVSQKKYAQLLYELTSPKAVAAGPALNMSINRSTLKKRIQAMNILSPKRSLTKSLTISLVLLGGVTGFIACSDLQTSGITNQDVEQFQAGMAEAPAEGQPLYVLFEDADLDGKKDGEGEILEAEEGRNILAKIKPEYIKVITVLKDQSATGVYGERARNGVVEITLIDKELALNDLNPKPPPPPPVSATASGQQGSSGNQEAPPAPSSGNDFFIAVETMPVLIGGLAELQSRINYPDAARRAGIEGRVTVRFIVNEQGEVENPTVLRGMGAGLDEEALRVIRQARFEPGRQRGRPVRVQFAIPMVFRLPSSGNSSTSQSAYVQEPEMISQQMSIHNLETSESGSVSGTLIHANSGNTIPGANITVVGTNRGTATDANGYFKLEGLPSGDHEIIISYVGYEAIALNASIE